MLFSAMRSGKGFKSLRAEGGSASRIAGQSALLLAAGVVLAVMMVALAALVSVGG